MINEVVFSYLDQARSSAENQDYNLAFDIYIEAVKLDPRVKEAVENEFLAVLANYNRNLAYVEENCAQIYKNFITALNVYPGNTNILLGIGKYLMKNALYAEALCHFQKALLIDANLVEVEKSFNSAKRLMFPRNNFRFLNDEKRKQAYLATLRSIEQDGKQLSDINNASNSKLANVSKCITGRCDIRDILTKDKQYGQLEISDCFGNNTLFMMNRFSPGLFKDELLEIVKKTFEAKLLEGRRVTPTSAEYYIVGAKCNRVNSRFQLDTIAKELLGVPQHIVHVHYSNDSFHGKDIPTYNDLEYVTDDREVFKIDFNSYSEIVEKYNATEPYAAILTSNEECEINVLVGWFNLHLNKNVSLTTNPRSPDRTDAWPQAVFYDFVPRPVKKHESVFVEFLTHKGQLQLLSDKKEHITRLSSSTIAFLNDSVYVNAILSCLGVATVHLTQICDMSLIDIADLCPFPIFGMFMLKRGARSLVCYARSCHDKEFIQCVFQRNDIPLSKVTILTASHWNISNKVFHAIVYNVLELCGDIDARLCRTISNLAHSHLVDNGLTFPANVNLIGQLISSERLDTLTKVKENGPMSHLAPHVNMFQASQAYSLDPFRLEHERLSDPVVISSFCHENMSPGTITVPVKRDGACNAVLCWYEIHFINEDKSISTYRKDSFIDSTAFLVQRPVQVHCGDSVIRCVDFNGSFKLVFDVDL